MSRRGIVRGLVLAVILGAVYLLATPHDPRGPAVTPLAPWTAGASLRETFESFPPTGDETAEVRLIRSNSEAWLERWRLLASARHSIDLSYFILHQDVFGMAFLGHLLERARSGVHIRLLLDAQGTKMSWTPIGNDVLDELVATGNVEIRTYRPLPRRALEALLTMTPTAAIASDHDKIIVVDGRESLIGGRNIGVEYFVERDVKRRAFSDADVAIRSRAAAEVLTRAFEAEYTRPDTSGTAGELSNVQSRAEMLLGVFHLMDDWLHGRAGTPDDSLTTWRHELAPNRRLRGGLARAVRHPAMRVELRLLDSQTRFDSPDDPITRGLDRLVRSAQRSILIETPYLVLSEEGVAALADAAGRGVAITILTNSPVSSDNALSQAFFQEQWPTLLARVPGIRLYVRGEPSTLHGKSAVFDGRLAFVGTYNLDPTSQRLNSEVMAVAWSDRFANELARGPRRMIAAGPPTTYQYCIRRNDGGEPLLDDHGRPIVEFGPEQHSSPSEWRTLSALWTALRATERVSGASPFL
jgi:phosphatidylserine/phosphatidylglycerophosphate/cardiolipin synthase-like enzyme